MFDIPDKGKEIVLSYFKERFKGKEQSPSKSITNRTIKSDLSHNAKLKNLLISEPLIIKS